MCKTRFVLAVAVLLLGAGAGQALAADDPYLVGWWQFDEGSGTVAKDSSGHNNNGTLNGGPQWVSGYSGGALKFDGTDDYLDCGNDASLDLTAWTISFWLNCAQNKDYNAFVVKGLDAAENYEFLGFGNGSLHMPITMEGGTRTYVNTATGVIPVGEWVHLAYSYSSTTGRRVYKDGSSVYSDAPSGTPKATTEVLTIGNERPMTRFTNGTMDDVRIYNRVLTAAQVKAVAAGGVPVYGKAEGPSPADGALAVTMPLLQWTAGDNALFHNVYLGTTPTLTEANLVGSRQMFTMLYHAQGLQPGTTYYWRVDEIDKDGVTVHTGDLWSFVAQALTAYHPTPTVGTVDIALAPMLTWLPGQTAIKHHVYFGDSNEAVSKGDAAADKGEVKDPNFAPGTLESLTTYYWRVDETPASGAARTGPVWTFTTCLPVDDFEGYTDDEGSRIYETWVDGWTNGTGSTVGNTQAPFAEQTIVHGGKQSMPLDYNNVKSPFYSEVEQEFAPTQDWAAGGVTTLSLWIRGRSGNAQTQLYLAVEDASKKVGLVAYPDQAITSTAQWTQWKIPLSSITGVNLAKVKKLYIGLGDRTAPAAGGTGRIFIDDILLTK
ncbi:MAG: LamG domain-containing protein [Planctomycetes bacterium]|nr:LamG domain-containing protein [Planctomycetota bacterium]